MYQSVKSVRPPIETPSIVTQSRDSAFNYIYINFFFASLRVGLHITAVRTLCTPVLKCGYNTLLNGYTKRKMSRHGQSVTARVLLSF
jgi:hypothetical protein